MAPFKSRCIYKMKQKYREKPDSKERTKNYEHRTRTQVIISLDDAEQFESWLNPQINYKVLKTKKMRVIHMLTQMERQINGWMEEPASKKKF